MAEWLLWLANPLDELTGLPRLVFVVLWQSTTVAVLALLLATIARRPATKAWITLLGICAAFSAPLATTAVRAMGGGAASSETTASSDLRELPAEQPTAIPLVDQDDNEAATLIESTGSVVVEGDDSRQISNELQTNGHAHVLWNLAANIIVVSWLAASGVIGVRLAVSARTIRTLLRGAEPCHDPRITEITSRVAERYGIASPTLLVCGPLQSPAIFGIRKSIVLVSGSDEQLFPPQGTFPASAWEAVLRHELAHIRRGDPLARATVELIVAMLPCPAMWLLRRRFYASAEEACDDWAVFDGTRAVDLAALLTDYASKLLPTPIGNAMDASDTKRRILRLLSTSERRQPRTSLGRSATMVGAAMTLVIAVAAAQAPADEDSAEHKSDKTANSAPAASGHDEKPADGLAQVGFGKDRPYIIEPPDILTIEVGKLVPASPHKIEKLDSLQIVVDNALVESPIAGIYTVNSNGDVNLGPAYGKVVVAGLTEEEATAAVEKYLREILREPRVALTIAQMSEQYHIEGQHLVGPDGNMSLGVFGQVHVSGLTLEEAKREIVNKLVTTHFQKASIALDVHSYNSKVFYIIEDNNAEGDRVTRLPITGNETVLDALANVESIRIHGGTKIWVSRATKGGQRQELEVDWDALIGGGDSKTNYQLLPGDRVFVAQPEGTK